MAVGLLRAKLDEVGCDDVSVESAGTHGLPRSSATTYAREVMRVRGIDIGAHRSRRLTMELVEQADLVLVMERNHRWYIQRQAGDAADKLHTMSELVGKDYSIRDPYRGSLDDYEYIAQELEGLIDEGWPTLVSWLYPEKEELS